MSTDLFSADDHRFMAQALQLARRGLYTTYPNPRVGCIIVKNGVVIGEGWHERAGQPHAEVFALRQASEQACGADVYVTLEPCSHHGRTPPCADALIQAGVKRVVAACLDPNPLVSGRGLECLQQAGICVQAGLLSHEARALNAGFMQSMQHKKPFVRLKMAMSLDGRTAMASGESTWITSEAARRDVQFWRAQASAVLTGVGTVLADDPALNVRLTAQDLAIQGEVRQPVRVIVDSQLRIPPTAKLFHLAGEVLIYTVNPDPIKHQALEQAGAKIIVLEGEHLSLPEILNHLAMQCLHEIHVECGATLAGALMAQDLVDELVIYMAPHLMGSSARPLFHLPQLARMQERIPLEIQGIRAVGKDWRILACRPNKD